FINKPMPGGLPKRTARALLDVEDPAMVPIIRDPAKVGEDSDAVFYFPGCGYPQTSAGRADQGEKITVQNRVLFHRVANTLNYLDIKTVVVSCGTCMD